MFGDIRVGITLVIFAITIFYLMKSTYPKSIVAILGATLMLIIGVVNEKQALESVGKNLEILLLHVGLMVISEIMAESGMFQWLAIKVAQLSKGEPLKIMLFLCVITGVTSAFLDNITIILLLIPISILLCKQLRLDPFPFIMSQIFAANIGGVATLIGDTPNLLIGAASGLDFNSFIVNLAPLAIINMIILLITLFIYCKKSMVVPNELKAIIMDLDSRRAIKNAKLMKQSLILYVLVLIGFLTNTFSHLGLATIAIAGSVILMLISKKEPDDVFQKIEWETLFLFGGLFVIVEAINNIGALAKLSNLILLLADGSKMFATQIILVVSTLVSPFVGAVPFTLSFIKVINGIIPHYSGNINSFWWALALGACLGGNMMLLGSACNLVAASIAKKNGIEISFMRYLKFGIFVVFESLILSSIYLYFLK